MTRRTKAGKAIYMDRFIEWLVRDMRGGVGKFYRSGTHSALERQAALLNLKKQFKSEFDVDVGDAARTNLPTSKKLGKVFCHTLVCFEEHGLWKHGGNPRRMNIGEDFITPDMIDAPCLWGEEDG